MTEGAPLRLVYEGRTDGVRYGSWALVNRRLIPALASVPDVEVEAVDPGGFPADAGRRIDVWLSHYYPGLEPGARFRLPDLGIRWIPWVAWELGPVPRHWEDAWRAGGAWEVWTCSPHARRLVLASTDLDPARVRVMPYGVDTEVFGPQGPTWEERTPGAFRVLYVGGAIARKGCDLAIRAYCRAFPDPGEAHSRLVLKLQGFTSFYAQAPGIGAPERQDAQLLTSDAYSDAQMAALYRSVDVVVQPYRAEGFCLPLLEAMACGVPVVYPAHGPAPAYVPQGAGICVPSTRGVADVEAIARALRWLWKHPEQRRAMGGFGREGALAYAWPRRAEAIVEHLREVVGAGEGVR